MVCDDFFIFYLFVKDLSILMGFFFWFVWFIKNIYIKCIKKYERLLMLVEFFNVIYICF